jgi:hypothetical protein
METFRNSPGFRMGVRTVVVAILGYLLVVFGTGLEAFELDSFLWGFGQALVYAVVGLLTPMEPFVGPDFAKPEAVQVPSPPAVPDN